jgi:acetyl esterase/lipase
MSWAAAALAQAPDSAPPRPAHKAVEEIPLYPGAAPGSEKWDWSERSTTSPTGQPMVTDVVRPVLLHYPAERGKAVGTAMIVAPGGGLRVLMMSYEGVDIARRLNAMGIDAFVLKYRLSHRSAPAAKEVVPLATDDGRQAVRLVRERAGEFGVRPNRVGMIGFSAGGVVTSGALFGPAPTRPDFAALIYGAGEIKEVPSPAPPLFLAVAADDTWSAGRSVELFTAYRKAKGPAELHVFQMGAHGFVNKGGGADHFMDRLEEWLAANKLLSKPAAGAAAPGAAPGVTVIPVWPGAAPGSEDWKQKEVEYKSDWDRKRMVRNVTAPTLTAFLPDPAVATGAAVVICPGGGFRFLSWQSEGTEVAEWLRARGVAAFVLKYRVVETPASEEDFRKEMTAFFRGLVNRRDGPADAPGKRGEGSRPAIPESMRKISQLAIADGRQALKVVRRRAAEWGIKPDRVGIMGFSAGGMVTMGVVLDSDKDSRPDFAAPIYGGGTGGASVPEGAPPLFILCAADDRLAAAGSARLYAEWRTAGRPAELHIYEKGGHGFGMTPRGLPVDRWIERYGDWLAQRGLIKTDTKSPRTGARAESP